MLSFYYCRFVFFVHAFDGLAGVIVDVFVAGLYRVLYIDDLLFSKVFQVHIFCPAYFLQVFIDLYLHLVNKADSDRVQELLAETGLHICQNNEEKRPTASEFSIFCLELLFLFSADYCIEKTTNC